MAPSPRKSTDRPELSLVHNGPVLFSFTSSVRGALWPEKRLLKSKLQGMINGLSARQSYSNSGRD